MGDIGDVFAGENSAGLRSICAQAAPEGRENSNGAAARVTDSSDGAATEPGSIPIRAVEIRAPRPPPSPEFWAEWRSRVVAKLSGQPGPNPVVLSAPDGRREVLPVLSSLSGEDKFGRFVEVTWTTIPGSPSNGLRHLRGEEVIDT